jgi:hypothetical protein
VIQYTTLFSTWTQSTGFKSFFFHHHPKNLLSPPLVLPNLLALSSLVLPLLVLTIPLETLGVNRARAVETSLIRVITLHHAPPEDSAILLRTSTIS